MTQKGYMNNDERNCLCFQLVSYHKLR